MSSSGRLPPQERASKIIELLKAVGNNPDRKIEDIAHDHGVSRSNLYNWINEFIHTFIMTDADPDFPRRLLMIYNKDLPEGSDKLSGVEVEQLRHYVDEYYARNLPPPSDNINSQENPSTTMSYNNSLGFDPSRDVTTEEGYLRSLLMNAKYVNPTQVERFIQQYTMNREVFDKNPMELLDMMKYMFGPQAGQNIFNLWQKGRGKFVYGADQQNQGMDPTMMAMMMAGGNVNPAMLGMLQGGGGSPNAYLNAMMISQMNQQSQREAARREQQEMMERMMQMMMMRFATQAVDDRKPWMESGGMGMPGMGYSIQEYPDETGKIKYRAYVPNFPGMQQQHQGDPMMSMIMGKQMDLTNLLMAKMADTGKQPTDLLLGLIPHFKAQGDMGQQMSQMIDTINKVAPGFFDRRNEPKGNTLEEAKLKFDTDLAKMAQQIELAKMQHNWRVDEMDRQAANDNSKSWMSTFSNLGDRIVTDIAPAVLKGFGAGGLGKEQQAQQMNPALQQQMMMQRQQQMQMARQQEQQRREQEQLQSQQMQQAQIQQPQQDPGTVYLITALQQQLQNSENNNKILMEKLNEIQNQHQQARQQQFQFDEKKLGKMSTGQLQTLLQELQLQGNAENRLKSVIESEIHNRQIIGDSSVSAPEPETDLPMEPGDAGQQFNTGEEPVEGVSDAQDLERT